jgi:broad specificity phosphatase PhoE
MRVQRSQGGNVSGTREWRCMDIWLARHGATEWSVSGRHTGTTDLPLGSDGERQARALGAWIGDHPFVRVLSSPLLRARQTARVSGFDDNRVDVTPLLSEVDYGEYEGTTTADILATRPGWELFRDGSPAGEAPQEIAARAGRLLAVIGHPGGDVLLFGHGHMLRALAAVYLGLEIEAAGLLRLDAGTISVLGREHGHPALALWNLRPPG